MPETGKILLLVKPGQQVKPISREIMSASWELQQGLECISSTILVANRNQAKKTGYV